MVMGLGKKETETETETDGLVLEFGNNYNWPT